jgi:hypothetical protein
MTTLPSGSAAVQSFLSSSNESRATLAILDYPYCKKLPQDAAQPALLDPFYNQCQEIVSDLYTKAIVAIFSGFFVLVFHKILAYFARVFPHSCYSLHECRHRLIFCVCWCAFLRARILLPGFSFFSFPSSLIFSFFFALFNAISHAVSLDLSVPSLSFLFHQDHRLLHHPTSSSLCVVCAVPWQCPLVRRGQHRRIAVCCCRCGGSLCFAWFFCTSLIWIVIGFICLCLLQTKISAVLTSMVLSKGLSVLLQFGVDACWFSLRFACQLMCGTWEQYRHDPRAGSRVVRAEELETPFISKSIDLPLRPVVRIHD